MSSSSTNAVPPAASRWPNGIRALSYRDYRLMWIGAVVSNIGTWMQIMAQAWVVYELSQKDPFWLGADAFAAGLPVLLTPFAGVLADRVDRRRFMGIVIVLQTVVSVWLSVRYGMNKLTIGEIIACSAVSGTLSTLLIPTFVSLMPDLVDRKDLPNAVALNSMGFNCARVIGPMIGGIVLYQLGATWSFALNAMSFLAVIAALFAIRTAPDQSQGKHARPWESLLDGLRYLRGRPDILAILVIVLCSGVFVAPIFTMLPAYARVALGRGDEEAYAHLLSAFGVGAVIGSLLLAMSSHKIPSPWRAIPFLIMLGAIEIAAGAVSHFWMGLVLIGIAGALQIGTLARLNTAMIATIPDAVRGRLASFFFLAIAGGIPVGSLLAGVVAKRADIRVAFWIFGGLLIATIALIGFVVNRKKVRFQPDAAVHSELTTEAKLAEPMV